MGSILSINYKKNNQKKQIQMTDIRKICPKKIIFVKASTRSTNSKEKIYS